MIEKEKGQTMNLTKTELEIICHRLAVTDAITEVVAEEYPSITPETIMAEVKKIMLWFRGERSVRLDWSNLTDLQQFILLDCAEGSTFFASLEDAHIAGDISSSRLSTYHRAADSLEEKLTNVIQRHVRIPRG